MPSDRSRCPRHRRPPPSVSPANGSSVSSGPMPCAAGGHGFSVRPGVSSGNVGITRRIASRSTACRWRSASPARRPAPSPHARGCCLRRRGLAVAARRLVDVSGLVVEGEDRHAGRLALVAGHPDLVVQVDDLAIDPGEAFPGRGSIGTCGSGALGELFGGRPSLLDVALPQRIAGRAGLPARMSASNWSADSTIILRWSSNSFTWASASSASRASPPRSRSSSSRCRPIRRSSSLAAATDCFRAESASARIAEARCVRVR